MYVLYVCMCAAFVYLSGGPLGVTAWGGRVLGAAREWVTARRDALLPPPVRGVGKVSVWGWVISSAATAHV